MRKKKKEKIKLTPTGRPRKIIDPVLQKARYLKKSLDSRIVPELKHTTPSIVDLHKWLTRDTYICNYSFEVLELANVTIDHKIPISRGGDNTLDNLCIASNHMNTIKGSLTHNEFRDLLELVKKWDDHTRSVFFGRLKRGGSFGRR